MPESQDAEGRPGVIEPESVAFLIKEFTDLRDGLAADVEKGGSTAPDPTNAARKLAIYDALLAALVGGEPFPEDDRIRQHVADVLHASDRENKYEEVELEHRALSELLAKLDGKR